MPTDVPAMPFPRPSALDGLVPPGVVAVALANWELAVLFPLTSAFLVWLLRYETGIPLRIGVLLVPPVTAAGFGVAFWIHVGVGVTVLQALGVLCAALVPVLVAFDAVFSGRRSPLRSGPPSRRG
jgi:hypothetical protein